MDRRSKRKIVNSARIYEELSQLLKKSRSVEQQSKVEKILNSQLSPEEMVEHINEIDLNIPEPEEERKKEIERLLKEPPTASKPLQKTKKTKEKKAVDQTVKLSFFKFLFSQFFPIYRFAKQTRTLKLSLMPIGFKYTGASQKFLKRSLEDSKLLLGPLRFAMEEGWKVLTKFEYNLMSVSYGIIRQISFVGEDLSMDDLDGIQQEYLRLLYYSDANDKATKALFKVLDLYSEDSKEKGDILTVFNRLFLPYYETPCLISLIQARWVMAKRRYITERQMIKTLKISPISSSVFYADKEIHKKIKLHLYKISSQHLELRKQYAFYLFLRSSIGVKLRQVFSQSLRSLYEFKYRIDFATGDVPDNWRETIFDDFIHLSKDLLTGFIEGFEPLFQKPTQLINAERQMKETVLFSSELYSFFDTIIDETQQIESQMENRKRWPRLSYSVFYIDTTYDSLIESEKHEYVFFKEKIDLISNTLFRLTRRLYFLLIANNEFEQLDDYEKIALFQEKENAKEPLIPYTDCYFNQHSLISQMSPIKATSSLFKITLNLSYFFKQKDLLSLFSNSTTLKTEINNLQAEIKRIE